MAASSRAAARASKSARLLVSATKRAASRPAPTARQWSSPWRLSTAASLVLLAAARPFCASERGDWLFRITSTSLPARRDSPGSAVRTKGCREAPRLVGAAEAAVVEAHETSAISANRRHNEGRFPTIPPHRAWAECEGTDASCTTRRRRSVRSLPCRENRQEPCHAGESF